MPSPVTRDAEGGFLASFRRLLFASGCAALLSGLFMAVAHQLATVPLILKAEVYESAADESAAHEHADGGEAWTPGDGLERSAYTVLSDIATAFGFALLLCSVLALRGSAVGWREGIGWGLAGFATFALAPSLGLPPELPGTEAAALASRQLWWVATTTCTGLGLGLVFLARSGAAALAGVVLIALPHLYGAPLPEHPGALAPETLSRQFAATAIVVSFLFWAVLGASSGYFHARFAES